MKQLLCKSARSQAVLMELTIDPVAVRLAHPPSARLRTCRLQPCERKLHVEFQLVAPLTEISGVRACQCSSGEERVPAGCPNASHVFVGSLNERWLSICASLVRAVAKASPSETVCLGVVLTDKPLCCQISPCRLDCMAKRIIIPEGILAFGLQA